MTMIMSMLIMMSMMMVVMMTQQCKDVRAEQRVESPPDKLQLARAAQQPSHNEDGGQRKSSQSSSGLIISNKNCNKQRGCRSTLLWSSSSEKACLHFTSLLLGLFLFTRPATSPLMSKIRLTTESDDCDFYFTDDCDSYFTDDCDL